MNFAYPEGSRLFNAWTMVVYPWTGNPRSLHRSPHCSSPITPIPFITYYFRPRSTISCNKHVDENNNSYGVEPTFLFTVNTTTQRVLRGEKDPEWQDVFGWDQSKREGVGAGRLRIYDPKDTSKVSKGCVLPLPLMPTLTSMSFVEGVGRIYSNLRSMG